MGQRGPAPTPAALKLLKGDHHRSRIVASPQPTAPPAKPQLTAEASKVWDRILAATADTEHIGEAHADTLRTYCEVTARLFAHVDPMSKEWRELANSHRQLARELCLTPATSTSLTTRTKAPERKLTKYVS